MRARRAEAAADEGPYSLPRTVSLEALIEDGSDRRFRALVSNLFTIASRMELTREHLARRIGISGPQYSLLVAVAHLQGRNGIGVGALAQALHVSSAFVATETGKLARRGLLIKRINPLDRRGVLLSVAPAGRLSVNRVSREIRAVNDLFFGALDSTSFAALSEAASALIESSGRAVRHIASLRAVPQGGLRRTG
jgi:DNA-binding MarR family transcriptional regulator